MGLFLFAEKSITAQIYLDVLTEYVSPQLEQYQLQVIFQQNRAPLHWGLEVCQFLNEIFSDRWIGRVVLFHGRHVLLILYRWGFFPVGYVLIKDIV